MNAGKPVSPELVEAAMQGGMPEADELIRAAWPRAYRIAFSVVRNTAMAEDAAQEACAVLFRFIRRLRSKEAFGVWFYRIVVREALALEKRSAAPAAIASDDAPDLDGSLLRIDISTALASLTPPQRVAIALHYYAEMSSREIAEVLGMPDSSVRFHIMRARRALEIALADSNALTVCKEEPSGAA